MDRERFFRSRAVCRTADCSIRAAGRALAETLGYAAGAARPPCRAQPQGGGPGLPQRIVRPGLASIRLPTAFVFHLRTFHDAEVPLRAGAECLKRLLVSLAFVSRPGDVIAVEFDKDRRLLQSGFVGLHLAGGHGQKAPAE